jgi:hypothetical protein
MPKKKKQYIISEDEREQILTILEELVVNLQVGKDALYAWALSEDVIIEGCMTILEDMKDK